MNRALRTGLVASAALSLLLLPGCNSGSGNAGTTGTAPSADAVVNAKNIAFSPKSVTIKSGQTVLWKFSDGSIIHNVTGDTWRSPDRSRGYYTHKFDGPGTYTYKCTIHTGMNGDVFVTP